MGTCANVADNTADPPNCAANPPCGNTGVCVGGACQQAAATVTCGAGVSCTNGTYQPQSRCTGTGTCGQQPTISCSPLICNQGGTACLASCNNTDSDCVGGFYCTGPSGMCTAKKALGATCGGNHECVMGNCVDGVCCMTSSCPSCQSCGVNGVGTCANVPDGNSDPPNCVANPPCGNTGFCVGGACQQAATTVTCGIAESCTGTTYRPPSHCTGSGTCNQLPTTSCSPLVCSASGIACLPSCNNNDDDCVGGYYCTGTNGTCQPKKGLGAGCMAGNECGSGNCIDGVCCLTGGCGTCQACDVNGAGTCANIPDGQAERHGGCAPNGNCGNTGFCSGGTCTQVAAGIQCSGFFCQGSTDYTFQPGGSCNGAGTCVIPSSVDCRPYKCTTGSCYSQCTSDAQCTSTAYCTGNVTTPGNCVTKKVLGASCSGDGECGMGHCTEGVCCDVASCGLSCWSCRVSGLEGTCNLVPAGLPDPTGTCTNEGAQTCRHNGLCNGGGNCQDYSAATECMTSCDGTNFTHTFCDGAGMCLGMTTVDMCPTMTCTSAGCDPSI
jgi:hypothetical protein